MRIAGNRKVYLRELASRTLKQRYHNLLSEYLRRTVGKELDSVKCGIISFLQLCCFPIMPFILLLVAYSDRRIYNNRANKHPEELDSVYIVEWK